MFLENSCLSAKAIEGYIKGGISPDAREKIEAHLKECDLCREAVDGIKEQGNAEDLEDINKEIQQKVNERTQMHDKSGFPGRTVLLVAASIAILVSFWFIYQQAQNVQEPFLAVSEEKETREEEVLAGEDIVSKKTESDNQGVNPSAEEKRPQEEISELATPSEELVVDEQELLDEESSEMRFETPEQFSSGVASANQPVDNIGSVSEVEEEIVNEVQISSRSKKAALQENLKHSFSEAVPERRQEIPAFISADFVVDTFTSFDNYLIYRLREINQLKLITQDFTLEFTINKEGKITEPEIDSAISDKLREELLSIFLTSPEWKPATKDGKVVEERIILPLKK